MKTGAQHTIKQIISQANSIAVALVERGITKSDIFCCFSANNLQYAILQFCIYLLGNTYTPATPTNGPFETKNQIKNSGSTVVFTSVSNAQIVQKVIKQLDEEQNSKQIKLVVVLDGNYGSFLTFDQLFKEGNNKVLQTIPYFDVKPKEDLFCIIYTSGSTGLPKGAMITHYNFTAILDGIQTFYDFSPISEGKIALIYPIGHASGNMALPCWISAGHTLVIYEQIDEELILQSVEKYKLDILPIFPAFGHRLIEGDLKDKYDLSSLRMIPTVGSKFPAKLAQSLINKYNIIFREAYASTEYCGILDNNNSEELIFGNVGRVTANTELKIIDLATGQSLGPNEDGEICLRGPKLFVGYLNNESATKEAIDSNGWFHTGDIGHYDEEERLFITDRLKELLKFKAWSVAPAEIESLLLSHESIDAVVVIGVKHAIDGQHPRAYVKVKQGKQVSEQELVDFVAENMAFQKRLRAGVRFVHDIPLSGIGKVDRQYFKNLVKDQIIDN